jgi:hypothetical protein
MFEEAASQGKPFRNVGTLNKAAKKAERDLTKLQNTYPNATFVGWPV